jgi:hypothetical protein
VYVFQDIDLPAVRGYKLKPRSKPVRPPGPVNGLAETTLCSFLKTLQDILVEDSAPVPYLFGGQDSETVRFERTYEVLSAGLRRLRSL